MVVPTRIIQYIDAINHERCFTKSIYNLVPGSCLGMTRTSSHRMSHKRRIFKWIVLNQVATTEQDRRVELMRQTTLYHFIGNYVPEIIMNTSYISSSSAILHLCPEFYQLRTYALKNTTYRSYLINGIATQQLCMASIDELMTNDKLQLLVWFEFFHAIDLSAFINYLIQHIQLQAPTHCISPPPHPRRKINHSHHYGPTIHIPFKLYASFSRTIPCKFKWKENIGLHLTLERMFQDMLSRVFIFHPTRVSIDQEMNMTLTFCKGTILTLLWFGIYPEIALENTLFYEPSTVYIDHLYTPAYTTNHLNPFHHDTTNNQMPKKHRNNSNKNNNKNNTNHKDGTIMSVLPDPQADPTTIHHQHYCAYCHWIKYMNARDISKLFNMELEESQMVEFVRSGMHTRPNFPIQPEWFMKKFKHIHIQSN